MVIQDALRGVHADAPLAQHHDGPPKGGQLLEGTVLPGLINPLDGLGQLSGLLLQMSTAVPGRGDHGLERRVGINGVQISFPDRASER